MTRFTSYLLVCFIGMLGLSPGLLACGGDNGLGSGASWSCNVSLELGSTVGNGSGTGGSRDDALRAALKTACGQLGISGETLSRCESNMDFGISQTTGNITIVTPAGRSTRCSGSS